MLWSLRTKGHASAVRAAAAIAAFTAWWALPAALDAQTADEEPAATAAAESPLAQDRRARDALAVARDFESALNPAQKVVDAQRVEREAEYPEDLAALGAIQGQLRQIEPGVANLLAAIEIVVADEGEYSPTLIQYYHALGRIYTRGSAYNEAIVSLEQAQHITQRHLGLFTTEQSALIDDITTAYLGLGDTIEARKLQLERLDNAVRRWGPGDPRVIPFRYTLAKYYERSRLPESAREQYVEVLKSQETRLGGTSVGVLPPLRELVAVDLLVQQTANPENRDRLAAVLEQNPDAPPAERGLSLALLGDWATVAGDATAARSYYVEAWNALSNDPERDVRGMFAKPEMLDFVAPISNVDRQERNRPYTWVAIVLEFNVSAAGLPSAVKVVTDDDETETLQSRYTRRLRETHFRPRVVDGEPVATSNVRSTHYVRRYIDRNEDDEEESEGTTEP
jgi:tetratricopeptide (TPR) repeat protein